MTITPPPEHEGSPSSSPSSSKESKASSSSSVEVSTSHTTPVASAAVESAAVEAMSREIFLRRLEFQQQQQQQQQQQTEQGEEHEKGNENFVDEGYIGVLNVEEKALSTQALRVIHSQIRENDDSCDNYEDDDQLLIDYLSKYYCQQPSSSSSLSSPSSSIFLPLLPPTCWIQDIDPSSREFLKSLALEAVESGSSSGNCGGGSGILTTLLPSDHHPCTPLTPVSPPITTAPAATTIAAAESSSIIKNNKVGIHNQFHGAGLDHPRLSDDNLDRSELLPVDENDDRITSSSTSINNKIQPVAAAIASTSTSFSDQPTAAETQKQSEHHSLLLTILENQQRQMHELQIRLDAMGSMMARMEADVKYLCNARRNQQQQGQQLGMEERLRQMLPGFNIMGEGGGGLFGVMGGPPALQQQHQPPQPQAIPPPNQDARVPADNNAPHPNNNNNNNNNPIMILLNNHMQHHPRGIFFPLFVALFRILVTLPHRLRTILQSTGPGRVYVHIRQRALDLRAFDNFDLGSLMKLLIMLLIFTGRGSGSSGAKAARGEKRNGRGGGGQDRAAAAAGDDNAMLPFDVFSILKWIIEYWNGHRMHIMILSSLIGYLVQAGVMSFLYKVLWLEREDVWKAWMGPKEDDETDENEEQGGERDAADENRVEVIDGRVAINPPNPARNVVVVRPLVEPVAAARAIIRRGPNNGGFLYDLRCLILSFLLSLIPTWYPEAVPEPTVEAEQDRLPQTEAEQAEAL